MSRWSPRRAAAVSRLRTFLPRAGRAYARSRNFDEGWESTRPGGPDERQGVSGLSPWLQRRLLLEAEVVRAAVAEHGPKAAEKFVQEVLWRTYFKGWLAMRPSVWEDYELQRERDARLVHSNGRLRRAYARAIEGRTEIECADHWIRELRETGYLHNHARMWLASIWCFTLQLPWTLGAALFERHLLDWDPASNTLGWRWVAGLHTRGKHYVARASNIRKFTGGRFDPSGQLDENPEPLREDAEHPREPLPRYSTILPGPRSGLLVTTEDLLLERSELRTLPFAAVGGGIPAPLNDTDRRAGPVLKFDARALEDGLHRAGAHFELAADRLDDGRPWRDAVVQWARSHALERVVAVAPQIGPWVEPFERLRPTLADAGIELEFHRRAWDTDLYGHATAGFFKFKKVIDGLVRDLDRHDGSSPS